MQAMLRMDTCWCACCRVLCPWDLQQGSFLHTNTDPPVCVHTGPLTPQDTSHNTRTTTTVTCIATHVTCMPCKPHGQCAYMTRDLNHRSLVLAALAAALSKHAGLPQRLKFNGAWGNGRRACQPTAYNCVCARVWGGCLRNTRPTNIQRYTRTHTPSGKALHQRLQGVRNCTCVCRAHGVVYSFFQPATTAAQAAATQAGARIQVQNAPKRDGVQHTQCNACVRCGTGCETTHNPRARVGAVVDNLNA